MSKYEYTVIEMMNNAIRNVKATPLFLGGVNGSGGGVGGPPGGFVGKLPQRRVTYDTTEAESTGIIGSGSLVDNLNHIRYRIKQLETASGTASIDIYDDGVQVATGVTIIDFYDSLDVTDLGGGHVRVDSTASGTTSGFITDAPIDGLLYGRKNGAWAVVSGVASGVATTFEVHEDLTSYVNGLDTDFATYYPIISGTLAIYYNGIRQEPLTHYLENTDHLGFTTLFTPSGGVLLADYLTAVSGFALPSAGTTIVYYGSGTGYGDMLKSVYDTDNDGIVDSAESVPWSGITGKPATFPPDAHTHTLLSLTDTPSAYTGFGGYVLSVKGDESGVEFTLVSGGASGITDHTLLSNLNSTDYYHLTQAEYTDLTDGGNTTLHTHTVSSGAGGGRTLLSSQTPSGTGTITFSGIPGGHKKLTIEYEARSTNAADQVSLYMEFNGDTTAGHYRYIISRINQFGWTNNNGNDRIINYALTAANTTAAYPTAGIIQIPFYDRTAFYKSAITQISEVASSSAWQQNEVGSMVWSSGVAITQIDLKLSAGNFVDGSIACLYYED